MPRFRAAWMQFSNRTGRQDGVEEIRGIETAHGDVAEWTTSRDTKDADTLRIEIVLAISADEADGTRIGGGECLITPKELAKVGSGRLGAAIEVCLVGRNTDVGRSSNRGNLEILETVYI